MATDERFKGFFIGAAGGVAGMVAMRLYWKAATALTGQDPRALTHEGAPHALDEMAVAGQHHEEGESSTAAVGRMAREAVTGEAPRSEDEKETLSYTVHWSYGLATSGLYGAVRGPVGMPDAEGGLAFGTALWALGDELVVPLLGLSRGPTAFPLLQHVHRFGAHVAFGLATAAATQALYGLTEPSTPRRMVWKTAKTYLKWKAATKAVKGVARAFSR